MVDRTNKICTLVGSDKGGVGKSMIAMILALAWDKAEKPLKIIEIDHQMKLKSVLKDRVDLSLKASADLKEVSQDRYAAETFFNPAYELWMQCDSVTDLGANVTTSLLEWIRECEVVELAEEDGIHFRFVAVASPDDQAMKSAVASLENAHATFGRSASLFLVLNNVTGGSGFAPYEDNEHYQKLMRMRGTMGIQVINMPNCNSRLMEAGRAQCKSPLQVLEEAKDIAHELNLDRIAARQQERRLLNWIYDVQEAMAPLFRRTVSSRNSAATEQALQSEVSTASA